MKLSRTSPSVNQCMYFTLISVMKAFESKESSTIDAHPERALNVVAKKLRLEWQRGRLIQ